MTRRGRYYHELSMDVAVERDSATYQEPSNDAEDQVTEALRDLARWLYSRLECEYEHLNSDGAVEEAIVANDYQFTEDGKLYA